MGNSNLDRNWIVSIKPTLEPVTVDELKLFGRIDGSDEDALLAEFITAARKAVENYTNRSLITQTIKLRLNYWPSVKIELPRPPLQSVSSVVEVDESDVETTWASSNYYSVPSATPGLLVVKSGVTLPSTSDRDYSAYIVTYVAGYGDAGTDVDSILRQAIKLWSMQMYEQRNLTAEPPPEALNMLMPYRVLSL